MLKDKIENDIKEALKQKNLLKVSTLRLLKSDIQNYIIEKKLKEAKDEDIFGIIQKQIKRHQDSIGQFEKGGREDLAQKEKAELEILRTYMPKALSEEELRMLIEGVIQELQATGKKDFGRVIKATIEKAKGRADGKSVSKIVSEFLTAM